jgi:hypothetical protein
MIPEEEHSRGRLIFAKIFAFGTFSDDTFDVHATIEESRRLNEAVQRYVRKVVRGNSIRLLGANAPYTKKAYF